MLAFAGMTTVVTGASGGIGGAIAVALGERGARVCLGGRDRRRLEAAAERVDATEHGGAEIYRADLTVASELANVTAALRSRPDGIDVLVHSAGEFARGRFDATSVDVLDRLVALNVRSTRGGSTNPGACRSLRRRRGDRSRAGTPADGRSNRPAHPTRRGPEPSVLL